MKLRAAQQAYRRVRADFDVLEASRDRVLRHIDSGEQTILSPNEQLELRWLNARQAELYLLVQAEEMWLLHSARVYLANHQEKVSNNPAYAILVGRRIPPGMRDRAIDLALCLGTSQEELVNEPNEMS